MFLFVKDNVQIFDIVVTLILYKNFGLNILAIFLTCIDSVTLVKMFFLIGIDSSHILVG